MTEETRRQRIRTKVEEKLRPVTLPNFLTLVRMAIVPFFVLAVSNRDFQLAFLIFAIAGLTDTLDGWLARRFESSSLVGAYLDPLADKLLVTAALIVLTIPHGQEVVIPLWLAILSLSRDFLITLVAVVLYVVEDIHSFPPSVLGKVTTSMQVVTVCLVLLANVRSLPPLLLSACFYVSFGLVILSGFNYIYRASRFIEAKRVASQSADTGEAPDQR